MPNILATTGASTQPTNAKPVNNIQPTQEGVTIQHDAWTKTVPEAIANFLHISVLDFKIVPEYARILNYFPSSDSIKPKGVTIGEVLRTCLIPCVAIADVLAGKVRENGYGAVLTWFKRAEDFTKDDRTKSMDENIAELVRQMKLSNDIK